MNDPISVLPLSAIYCLSVLLVLVSLGLGLVLGRRAVRGRHLLGSGALGSAVAATLGLLAFMLGFTFNMTAERFGQRKVLLIEEINAIETAYLRADFLDADRKIRARNLLADYAGLRDIRPSELDANDYQELLKRSEHIQADLWGLVTELVEEGYSTEKLKAFYTPLNEVIDFHTSRQLVGLQYRIPTAIWGALYVISALAMFGVGFQLGASRGGSPQIAVTLALSFSLVILLIADLDRTDQGFLLVDQQPMGALSRRLQRALSGDLERIP